ncbi:MAG: hypothetical protein KDA61_05900, partial [Planctomycetales bacterium]|nr:hypothetical protein [Planctomycetales bacterium]
LDNMSMFTGAAPAQDGVLRLIVDRDTGGVQIINNTSNPVNLRGYSIESAAGAFNEAAATYLADGSSDWQVLDNPVSSELSEGYTNGSYAMPAQVANPTLGKIDLGSSWRKFYTEDSDVSFEYLVAGSNEPVIGMIQFVGNGGAGFNSLDLNFDGAVDILDYEAFLAGYNQSLVGKTGAEAHNLGDLDGDLRHSVADFQEFKRQFDQQRGPGAFAAALAAAAAVPEPSTCLACLTMGCLVCSSRRRRSQVLSALVILCATSVANVQAALPLLVEDFEGLSLGQSPEEQPTAFGVWTNAGPAGWTIDRSGVPGAESGDPANDGVIDWAGWAVANKDWWVAVAGDQDRSQFARGAGAVLIADPDEWDDAAHPDGKFNTYITTPSITIPAGIPAGKIKIAFDSSWRPEGFDDGDKTNNQTATVDVRYDTGNFQNVLTYDSNTAGPNYHPDATNEAIDRDLAYNGTATTMQVRFGLTQAANDWWWALDNVRIFVPSEPAVLRINTATGQASIVGGDVISETINGYDISSETGNLAPSGTLGMSSRQPDTVDGPDADAIAGNDLGENWQLAASNSNLFSEFFLDGSSSFTDARTESLGRVFNPTTPEGSRDVQFSYSTIFGDVVQGVVEYYTAAGVGADFNGDGMVGGDDFLIWQRGFGGPGSQPSGDADGNGNVNSADYAAWASKFGQAASNAAAVQVPEPTGAALATLAASAAGWLSRRRRRTAATVAAATLVFASAADQTSAQIIPPPTVDRDYRLGDNDPGAANGVDVAITRDNAGAAGQNQLIDMTATTKSGNKPKYVTVSDRPDGVTGLGIALNPSATDRQFLRTGADEALNFPERSPSSTEGTLPGGTIDYSFITDRGFQLWVKPTTVSESHIVMDSNNHGVLLDANGTFGMRYSGFDYAGQTTAVANQWYHLMVVRAFGDAGSGSVLYVNGIAEAAATGIYNGEDAPNDEANPVNHDNSPLVVGSTTSESPLQVGLQRYFHGVVDDLSMFVMGLNNTDDFGEFSFANDNDYAAAFAPSTPGDVNGDDLVTMADVQLFADNWLFENRINWFQAGEERSLLVGDLSTRTRGDFDYNGRVDLADWGILNSANPAMAAAAMAMIQAIPEPSAVGLAFLASLVACRRRVRETKQ